MITSLKTKVWDFIHKEWFIAMATGIVAVLVTLFTLKVYNDISYQKQYAEFDAHITISNTTVGVDPMVDYTRIIREDHYGTWSASVRMVGTGVKVLPVCRGEGTGEYLAETSGTLTRPLEWYVETLCDLEPGSYYVQTRWDLVDPQGNRKIYTVRSNTFEVLP